MALSFILLLITEENERIGEWAEKSFGAINRKLVIGGLILLLILHSILPTTDNLIKIFLIHEVTNNNQIKDISKDTLDLIDKKINELKNKI